jgi:Zn-dependent M28 family amino/carboxypeptidase
MKTTLALLPLVLLAASASGRTERPVDVDTILAADLEQHVQRLASEDFAGRRAGSEGGRLAGEYLAGQFASFGLEGAGTGGAWFQDFPLPDGGSSRNVLGMLPGSDPELSSEWILIGAHYDHLGEADGGGYYPGADDDAGGTAVMLELAQAFAGAESAPARSILFMGFGAEEMGLVGSKYYVENPLQPLDRIVAAVNLEMMGRGDEGSLTVMLLEEMPEALRAAAIEASAAEPLTLVDGERRHLRSGDQNSFYAAGVPILCFYGGETHPDYHSVTDTADKIQSDWMESVGRLVFRTVETLAGA